MGTWIGATIVATTLAVGVACTQPRLQPMPVIEDKIDRDAYLAREGGPT
jgi:poly(3-hydroxybutyrate) depolymerase